MAIDVKAYAEKFGLTEKEVTKRIEKQRALIKEALSKSPLLKGDALEAAVDKSLLTTVNDLFKLKGLDFAKEQYKKDIASGNKDGVKKIDCIVLGVSKPYDANKNEKFKQTKKYYDCIEQVKDEDGKVIRTNVDSEAINNLITSKQIKLGKSKEGKDYPIALYGDKVISYKDAEGKQVEKENEHYGEVIPDAWEVMIPLIVTAINDESVPEEFRIAKMRWDIDNMDHLPNVGSMSTIYGRFKKVYITAFFDAYEDAGKYGESYGVAEKMLADATVDGKDKDGKNIKIPVWYELEEVPDIDFYRMYAVKGTISNIDVKDYKDEYSGKNVRSVAIRVVNDSIPGGIKLKSTYEPVTVDITDNMAKNDDVIVIGRKMKFTNNKKQEIVYHELWGVLKEENTCNDEVRKRLIEAGIIKA